MEHEAIIEIEKVSKTYQTGGSSATEVLKNVNLDICSTDFAIIYGPSGSGKSTLLHHIAGLELPTEGKISIRGTDITKLSSEERAVFRAEKFGMVYQFWYWAKALSVLDNVAMPLYITGLPEAKAKKKAMQVLEELEMGKYANKLPVVLSGGEQQRVSLARALVNNPWIIVADEPTGNLDTHNADQVMQILQLLNVEKKRTVIMVTHNLAYLPLATKTIAMKDGGVVSSDTQAVREQIKEELKGVL
ncbi:MAG: ABC transporter ATP-binding protein [Patescibacteria group bacterium]